MRRLRLQVNVHKIRNQYRPGYQSRGREALKVAEGEPAPWHLVKVHYNK